MKKGLPIGVDNFKEAIEQNCYYVDKTNLIEELVTNASKVKLFPRPRRFGKTITLSMINYFFNIKKKEESKNLFKGLDIHTSKIAKKEKNKYPVINLNFKAVKGDNLESTLNFVKTKISELYEDNNEVKKILTLNELKIYEKIESKIANVDDYINSIKNLSKYLKKLYNEKVIVLIDEYDVPIDNSFHNGFYEDTIKFFKAMYSEALKTNDYLKFAVLTGVVRVSSESMFSELNHIKVYGIMEDDFSEYFGFTEKEVIECLKYYDLEEKIEEAKKWYNGYIFGSSNIYNPWSILNYAGSKRLECYWVNTGENLLLKKILRSGLGNLKDKIAKLLNDEEILCVIDENISYKELDNSEETVMTMLVLTGYLTVVGEIREGRKIFKILKIPNEEVKYEFERIIDKWLKQTNIEPYFERFKCAVLDGDYADMEEVLNEMLFKAVSFHDEPESLYHGLVLCMTLHFGNQYIVKSNREVGYGRHDICVEAKDGSFGAILEFKIARTEKDLENKLQEAITQIKTKKYTADLEERNVFKIHKYGIAFTIKKAKVRKG